MVPLVYSTLKIKDIERLLLRARIFVAFPWLSLPWMYLIISHGFTFMRSGKRNTSCISQELSTLETLNYPYSHRVVSRKSFCAELVYCRVSEF
jgi:hypothetical protein